MCVDIVDGAGATPLQLRVQDRICALSRCDAASGSRRARGPLRCGHGHQVESAAAYIATTVFNIEYAPRRRPDSAVKAAHAQPLDCALAQTRT